MKKVVIFARVSSTNGTQDYERQINDLQVLASANNWTVEAIFAEKVSGAKKNTERTELMNMIDYINSAWYFLRKYCIESLSVEALLKDYQRWRRKMRRKTSVREYKHR